MGADAGRPRCISNKLNMILSIKDLLKFYAYSRISTFHFLDDERNSNLLLPADRDADAQTHCALPFVSQQCMND